MTTNSRRQFLRNIGAAGAAISSFPRAASAWTTFPNFNKSSINLGLIGTFQGYFKDLGNMVAAGIHPSSSNLNGANHYYNLLVQQLYTSGFHSASLQWLAANRYVNFDNNLAALHDICVSHGLNYGFGKFYNALHNSPYRVGNFAIPPINAYGLPQSHVGANYSLQHWASQAPASPTSAISTPQEYYYGIDQPPLGRGMFNNLSSGLSSQYWSGIKCPSGMVWNEVVGNCIDKTLTKPGTLESFCFYGSFFNSYLGVMSIPLALPEAAFPPLGIAIGIAAAFVGMFEWGVCS